MMLRSVVMTILIALLCGGADAAPRDRERYRQALRDLLGSARACDRAPPAVGVTPTEYKAEK